MELPINEAEPKVMHIDLNSCFATVEQQANPLIRNRPVAVAAGIAEACCVISPSYEAKRMGVKVGFRVRDAKAVCPDIIILPPDPPKYRAVHLLFSKIFKSYSPNVVPKSIDEAIIDFAGTKYLEIGLEKVGMEIKHRMKSEIGDYITCNIGIGTNRFLAKTAASLHKPDGMDTITHTNLREVFETLELIDLCGINTRFQARLFVAGISNPIQFLDTSAFKLKSEVFKSVEGYRWYMRLRGWEVDNVEWGRKTYGQSYALKEFTNDISILAPLLMKLCEKMGRRLRRGGYYASGIHVGCIYEKSEYWHEGRKVDKKLYNTTDIYKEAIKLLAKAPMKQTVSHLMVNCYNLSPLSIMQLELDDTERQKKWRLSSSMDMVNDRYGEYVVTPALMMGLNDKVIDRVPFGGVKELEDIYGRQV